MTGQFVDVQNSPSSVCQAQTRIRAPDSPRAMPPLAAAGRQLETPARQLRPPPRDRDRDPEREIGLRPANLKADGLGSRCGEPERRTGSSVLCGWRARDSEESRCERWLARGFGANSGRRARAPAR